MEHSHLGELIALGTAFCWTATALAFQKATGRVGSLQVNILRLLIALVIYGLISLFVKGTLVPADASAHIWFWMSLSGLVGFVFGDYFLFKSYEHISARVSMLMMSLSPPIAAFISFIALGETMSSKSLMAMFITISGIITVITEKNKITTGNSGSGKKIKIKYSIRGLLYAFGGAIGQAGGIVLSKYGMEGYDVFSATHIRVITGSIGFIVMVFMFRQWGQFIFAVKDRKTMLFISIGAFFGPFVGVYSSLLSVKYTSVGIASTIMAIIPVLIIPPAIIFFKERVTIKEIIGSFIAVTGVALFFI